MGGKLMGNEKIDPELLKNLDFLIEMEILKDESHWDTVENLIEFENEDISSENNNPSNELMNSNETNESVKSKNSNKGDDK